MQTLSAEWSKLLGAKFVITLYPLMMSVRSCLHLNLPPPLPTDLRYSLRICCIGEALFCSTGGRLDNLILDTHTRGPIFVISQPLDSKTLPLRFPQPSHEPPTQGHPGTLHTVVTVEREKKRRKNKGGWKGGRKLRKHYRWRKDNCLEKTKAVLHSSQRGSK